MMSGHPTRHRNTLVPRAWAALLAAVINGVTLFFLGHLSPQGAEDMPAAPPVLSRAVVFTPPPPEPPPATSSAAPTLSAARDLGLPEVPTFISSAMLMPALPQTPSPALPPEVFSQGLSLDDALVFREAAVDTPAAPLHTPAPVYPTLALERRITGKVTVRLAVDAAGTVQNVEILAAHPPGIFEHAATAAVRQWRFQPARFQGRPVPVRVRRDLTFDLR